jgi:uncharacterized membrane protein YfcA
MLSSSKQTAMRIKAVWCLAAGAGAGIVAGFLGIGGGIVLVPIMTGLLWLDQHKAHGTSLIIIIPIAAVSTIVYAQRGHIDWLLIVTIGSGSIIGVVAGAKLMMKVSAQRLRQAFGLYAIAIAVLLLLK